MIDPVQTVDIRALWNYDEPAESENRFRALLDEQRTIGSDDLKAEILAQIARAQGLQRRFDDARKTLGEAKALLGESPTRGNAAYFLELGRVENSSENRAAAKLQFFKALELAERAKEDFLAVDAAHMIAIVETGPDALNWNAKAISMAEATSDPRARNWLGSLYNNLGWTYHEMGEYRPALELFQKALEFREGAGDLTTILIARYCVGKCLRSMGRAEEALGLQLELEAEHAQVGDKPGYCYEEIAECLLVLGRTEGSKVYFAKAYELFSKDTWLTSSEPERVDRLRKMAEGAGDRR